jgi:hypothetical protein
LITIDTVYSHYKNGDTYKVLAFAKHSETQEDMVVYQALYGDYLIWVRPVSMWEDVIPEEKRTVFGQDIRFKRLETYNQTI